GRKVLPLRLRRRQRRNIGIAGDSRRRFDSRPEPVRHAGRVMVRVRRLAGRATGERGFTLIELMIAVALLGVGMAFITNMFLNGWRLWKRSYDELNIQRNTRDAVALITRSLREASAATVSISTPAGAQQFGQIS